MKTYSAENVDNTITADDLLICRDVYTNRGCQNSYMSYLFVLKSLTLLSTYFRLTLLRNANLTLPQLSMPKDIHVSMSFFIKTHLHLT